MSGVLLEIIEQSGQQWNVQARRRRDLLGPRLTPNPRAASAILWAPAAWSLPAINAAYDQRRAWLLAHIAGRGRGRARGVTVKAATTLPFRGVPHAIVSEPGLGRRVLAADGQLRVGGPPEHLTARLARFLRDEARDAFTARVRVHALALGVRPRALAIRDTRSRWGSCTADGRLSFSWRPILAPDFVLDYLAAHEVAHLAHMDHSPRFWSAVDRLCPDWALAADYLRLVGLDLMRYQLPAAK